MCSSFLGICNKLPQTGWLKLRKSLFSPSWGQKPEVQASQSPAACRGLFTESCRLWLPASLAWRSSAVLGLLSCPHSDLWRLPCVLSPPVLSSLCVQSPFFLEGLQSLDLGSPLIQYVHACCSVTQPCLTLCDPMDCSPPGSSVHGVFQARILEWVAIPSSRGSSQPKDRTCVSCICRGILYR